MRGEGTEQDFTKSFEILIKSCDFNNEYACFNAGTAAANGEGTKQDTVQATQLYARASEMGSSQACALQNALAQAPSPKKSSPPTGSNPRSRRSGG